MFNQNLKTNKIITLRFSLMVVVAVIFFSCKKNNDANNIDKCPTSMKLTLSNPTPTVGTSFTITAPKETDNNVFYWSGPGYSETTSSNTLNITEAKYSNRGWYYCAKGNPECNTTIRDSVFVDVKLSQEKPSCNLINNHITSSNLVLDMTLTSVTQHMDPTFNAMGIYGGDDFGYPSLRVLFNSYNGNTEPVDGVYITNDKAIFDATQEYNVVSISFLYNSSYFHCQPYQKLYVSHVNGKIQVSFCNMSFSNGSIITNCTARMTEL